MIEVLENLKKFNLTGRKGAVIFNISKVIQMFLEGIARKNLSPVYSRNGLS